MQLITQVDAFTDKPFAGNPAAVCVLDRFRDEAWMRLVAREMNLSETAFVCRRADGLDFDLRWFTPSVEVDLCGHATLATAHVLFTQGYAGSQETVRFHTRSGILKAMREDGWITLDFPAEPAHPVQVPPELLAAFPKAPVWVGQNRMDYILAFEDEAYVTDCVPDFTLLSKVESRGVIITARSRDDRYDFVSRFFGPLVGVPEDPVTGSAHCCLTPYWAEELGKTEMVGYQASERGGVVRVALQGDRVLLSGQAVTVLQGFLNC